MAWLVRSCNNLMSIAEKYISQFQDIYRKKFGKEISKDQAREEAHRLVNFVRGHLGDQNGRTWSFTLE